MDGRSTRKSFHCCALCRRMPWWIVTKIFLQVIPHHLPQGVTRDCFTSLQAKESHYSSPGILKCYLCLASKLHGQGMRPKKLSIRKKIRTLGNSICGDLSCSYKWFLIIDPCTVWFRLTKFKRELGSCSILLCRLRELQQCCLVWQAVPAKMFSFTQCLYLFSLAAPYTRNIQYGRISLSLQVSPLNFFLHEDFCLSLSPYPIETTSKPM